VHALAQDAIMKLFGRLPKGGEGATRLQTLMFSATLHAPEIRELADKICQNPVFIDLKVSNCHHDCQITAMLPVYLEMPASYATKTIYIAEDLIRCEVATGQGCGARVCGSYAGARGS
jgi:hypothetical protein